MVAVSLLHFLPGRSRASELVAVLATLLIVLGLLAFVVILGAATADSSVVDSRLVGPFRWGTIDATDA